MMKKITAMLLLLGVILSSCAKTEAKIDENKEEQLLNYSETEIETKAETDEMYEMDETKEITELKEAEPKTVQPISTAEPGAADSAATAAAKTEKSAAEPVIMTIPAEYGQVYDILAKLRSSSVSLLNNFIFEDDVEVAAEAVGDSADMSYDTSASAKSLTSTANTVAGAETNTVYTADEYSKTNTQVENIDEGDIVKTDGKYIYILRNNEELIILSASGAETEVISKTKLTSNDYSDNSEDSYDDYYFGGSSSSAVELYVDGDFLAVVINCNEWLEIKRGGSYSYTNDTFVLIDIYDVSNPKDPIKTASLGQDGHYTASRMVDGNIYLITNYSLYNDFVREDYDRYIPSLYRNGKEEFVPVDCIVCPPEVQSRCYTVISSYNIASGIIKENKSVLGRSGTIYMSNEHIYLANTSYYEDVSDEYKESVYTVKEYTSGNRTEIIKLGITDSIVTEAVGTVNGDLLNQFSMDEYDGHLRVVTTEWANSYTVYTDEEMGFSNYKYSNSEQTNALYVFDEDMNIVGSITGLAKEERVYSVRFTGDIGYFVTFRQVDPLFAVDLSNPEKPEIMSELKIPGFSNYLHPYADGLLFGLGQDADEKTGRTQGMKLSMFDISDPYDVFERDKLSIGNSYSEALYNHKAILISPSRGIIGFPCSSGYVIYGYDTESGFYEITKTQMDDVWWDSSARGLYIGDMIYIVMQDFTVVMNMDNYDIEAQVKY